MNNIIPFPQNPAEAREDKEMAMEALIWETMAYDDRTAAAVAQFIYDLKLPIFTDLVQAIANENMSAAYNTAYTIVSEATLKAVDDSMEKDRWGK
ncbi:hypothetical protein NB643_08950 [Oxalobacter aliiformigenes]|uniref:DUF2164 domain-containing protein n=1 Tax=Oxalobacter aliiformigenes TaxID=2946593 RepID=A0ABY7JMT7_9BURK|nr:hypothetical protein [Oxalobacter aliiformigenes]WAV93584.1 hypothetical protein NB641_02185 [Oxalobacter aliiformigenes]WAV94919.1 hypothetical protein NB643_08950 [Oxalobacter aliiformigenes]WAV97279.1 hypothetical protein NB645_00510 [Oxalobacter aliiformigenes]